MRDSVRLRLPLARSLALVLTVAACNDGGDVEPNDNATCERISPPPSPLARCTDDDQLELPAPEPTCDDGAWSYAMTTRSCAQSGQRCERGACVDPAGTPCTDETPCLVEAAPTCDDMGRSVGALGFCQEGFCSVTTVVLEDCPGNASVCQPASGLCAATEPEPGCTRDEDCRVEATPACDGNAVTLAVGACADDGTCTTELETTPCPLGDVCVLGVCREDDTGLDCRIAFTCPAVASVCDGSVLRSTPAACDEETGECTYSSNERDCEEEGLICSLGACIEPTVEPDPCADVPCDGTPEGRCDENTAVTSLGEGSCAVVDGVGVCVWEEERVDCGDTLTCIGGTCARPLPGDCEFGCPVLRPGPPTCVGTVARRLVGFEQDEATCECDPVYDDRDCADTFQTCVDGFGCAECAFDGDCIVRSVPTCLDGRLVEFVGACEAYACIAREQLLDDCASRGEICDDGLRLCVAEI